MNQLNSAMLLFTLTLGHAWAAGFEGSTNTKLGQGAGNVAGDNGFSVFIGRDAGFYNTTGAANTFLGSYAGLSNATGVENTFVGAAAGRANSVGFDNTAVGYHAGYNNNGYANTSIGAYSGYANTDGYRNTFLGQGAGFTNVNGFRNVFIGYDAGGSELGSQRLYIANDGTTTPLIYGEFDNKKVTLNGNLEVVGPNAGLVRLTDVTTNATTKGARLVLNHYNNASLPVYLFGAASTPGQNFLAFGGGNAIGNAATQLDFFTGSTTTTATGTSRMTINGAGNIGMGVTSPAYPLHMASGALVTTGGVWTNASSRDYKENIKDLSTKEASLTLASLTPVTYNYKADKAQAHVGFIAEDVPELVATQDRKGLSPMDIVAVLTKVTQDQQRVIGEHQKVTHEQQRAIEEHEKIMQAQQQIITELREQNKAMAEQTILIPALSTALSELKREVRMGRGPF